MWPAIIMGIASLVGGIIQNHANKKAAAQQNTANLNLARYSADANQASIDKQNAYNSPESQMARYTAAGLNPALIYGSGSASAGNQQTAVRMDTPHAEVPANRIDLSSAAGGALNAYLDFNQRQAGIDNLQAQTRLTEERTQTEKFNALLRQTQGKTAEFDYDTKDMLRPYSLQVKESEVRAGKLHIDKTMQEITNLRKDLLLKQLVAESKKQDLSLFSGRRQLQNQAIESGRIGNQNKLIGINDSDNIMFRLFQRMIQNKRLPIGNK